MKKISLLLSIILLLSFFSSCTHSNNKQEKSYNRVIKIDGIDEFDKNDGNYSLNFYLLPTNDFIEKFEYINIDYHYREHYKSTLDFVGYEKSLMVIKYDETVYKRAKEFCLQNMMLSNTYSLNFNDYVFIENVELAKGQDSYNDDFVYSFPHKFNMFVYNDDMNYLVFLGFYCPDYTNEDSMLTIKNWGQFLDEHFSDVYSFWTNQGTVL